MKRAYLIPFVSVILCILLVISVALTRKTEPTDIQTISDLKEKETLHFASSWAGYDTNALPLQDVLQTYREKNKELELVDESMAGEDFLFTLKTDFATGNDPDVFGLWPGSDFDLLVEQGKVADLTEVLKQDPEWYALFHEDAWKYVTFNDKIYGVPFEIIYEGLFINVDLFETNHIKVPTTYEELVEAVVAFRALEITPIAYNTTPEGSFIYQNIVMKLGGKEDIEEPFDKKGKLKPCFIQGMYLMRSLYELGAFPDDAFLIDDKTRNDLFMNKKAAMIVQGSWFIGEQGLDPNKTTVRILPFVSITGEKAPKGSIIYGCGNGIFHISQKAWEDPVKRQYSLELLKTLTSVESAVRFRTAGGFISNIVIPEDFREQSYLSVEGENLINNASQLIGPTDSFIDRVIWETIIVNGFESMLKGEISPESIAQQAENAMKDKYVGVKP